MERVIDLAFKPKRPTWNSLTGQQKKAWHTRSALLNDGEVAER